MEKDNEEQRMQGNRTLTERHPEVRSLRKPWRERERERERGPVLSGMGSGSEGQESG